MPSCAICKKPVATGYVIHSDCMASIAQEAGLITTGYRELFEENARLREALESIRKYGDYAGWLAAKALLGEKICEEGVTVSGTSYSETIHRTDG